LRDDNQHHDHYHNQGGHDVNQLFIAFYKKKSIQKMMDEFDFGNRTSFMKKYLIMQ